MKVLKNSKILITGSAGFIGFHLAKFFLSQNIEVFGVDGMTDYYDINLKAKRNKILKTYKNFTFFEFMIEDKDKFKKICLAHKPEVIIHLAAQAGVRYSLKNPEAYMCSNLNGFFNVLESAKIVKPKHLIIASTSSVYGSNKSIPFKELDMTDSSLSFYAATKKANEVMSHSYSYNYKIPTTVLRFFTVYGPWGRPDMALFKFTRSILSNEPIEIYNNGEMKRDFTYIDDLIKSIALLINKSPKITNEWNKKYNLDSLSKDAPWRVVNIGNSDPVNLMDYIETLERVLGRRAKKKFLEMQPGDVKITSSSTELLEQLIGFKPNTPILKGIEKFVEWYHNYNSTYKLH